MMVAVMMITIVMTLMMTEFKSENFSNFKTFKYQTVMVRACVQLDATMTRRLRRNGLRASPSPVTGSPLQIWGEGNHEIAKMCRNGEGFNVVGESL